MEFAYKSLESTEKFCDTSKKLVHFFNPGSAPEKLSPHERLYRKSIVADCLLFEAVLVFVKQGVRSYVKGGYILRKAWKMYEKVFHEMEQMCLQPSPITNLSVSSPLDKHVGTSMYDQNADDQPPEFALDEDDEEGEEEEERKEEEEELEVGATRKGFSAAASLSAVGDSLAGIQLGLGGMDVTVGAAPMPTVPVVNLPERDDSSAKGHGNGGICGDGERGLSQRSHSCTGPLGHTRRGLAVNGGLPSGGSARSTSDVNLPRANTYSSDETDWGKLGVGGCNSRPSSGYFLPEDVESSIESLQHRDDRLRGAVYFGYGLMNIVMSLIPPNLKKLANLFGFHGNRRVGLQALEFSSNSQDMKAPLAR